MTVGDEVDVQVWGDSEQKFPAGGGRWDIAP